MNSIMTNGGAMVALQTLRGIGAELTETQRQMSTGLRVASAEDDPMAWAIASSLRADLRGYNRVQESLNLGDATLAVAQNGADKVVDLVTRIRERVTAAQGENVDRQKIQNDIDALRGQIEGIVEMASFNGENLLQNRDSAEGSGFLQVKSGSTRDGNEYLWQHINVKRRDLGMSASVIDPSNGTHNTGVVTATLGAGSTTATLDTSALTVEAGTAFSISVFGTDADGSSFDQASMRSSSGATESQAEMASGPMSYVARDGDTMADVNRALVRKWQAWMQTNGNTGGTLSLSAHGGRIAASTGVTDAGDTIQIAINQLEADAGNTIGGELEALADIDVTTTGGAQAAMAQMGSLVDTAIEAAASFGSSALRLDTQREFLSGLTDEIRKGIGIMVDADMEEVSARYQALLVQRDLATQALSIANNAPNVVLSLLR